MPEAEASERDGLLAEMDTLAGESLAGDTPAVAPTQPGLPLAETSDPGVADTVTPPEGSRKRTSVSVDAPEVIGHYERIRLIGQGGMGAVFLARDTRLGRRVAIKLLKPGGGGRIDRFMREARATAALQHEHIVVIHEVGAEGDFPFMVLEYLEGQPLRALLQGQPLRPRQAVDLTVPIVRALLHAHDHGIVHRDLKPENVFVTDSGVVKVLDFGIAKLLERGEDDHAEPGQAGAAAHALDDVMTSEGAVIGTVRYMAPEQFRGGAVDARADQYALGLMLYEMVSGAHPYELVPRDEARKVLRGELPVPPLSTVAPGVPGDLERLIARCLASDPAARFESAGDLLDALQATVPERYAAHLRAGESPYPGLSAFREADAGRFFGRSHDVSRVVSLLADQTLVAVVGPSGVGKSSLVRAGVIPALKTVDAWERFTVRPGRYPLRALATLLSSSTTSSGDSGERDARVERVAKIDALAQLMAEQPGHFGASLRRHCATKDARGLVFVDQFEECFTLAGEEEREAFLGSLLGAADDPSSPLRVIVSLRSDFLDRVAETPRLLDAVTRGLVLLRPPDRQQLEAALVQPAELAGYRFEDPSVVEAMLDALEGSSSALPLLQFAAGQLWEARDRESKRFTRASYDAMGGIRGLLASHADAVLAGLPTESRALVKTLFVRLVTAERTRAVVEREDLVGLAQDEARVQALLDRLVGARLLVVQTRETDGGATYELAHEALIESWPTLGRWLDEGREHAGFLDQLSAAARQWDQGGRSQGLLWRGEAAADAEHFARHFPGPLAPRERDFLEAVLHHKERALRFRRWSVVAIIAVLLGLVAVGSVALVRISAAEEDAVAEAKRAEEAAAKLRDANSELKAQYEMVRAREAERDAAQKAASAAQRVADAEKAKVERKEVELARSEKTVEEKNEELQELLKVANAAKAEAEAKAREAQAAARREKAAAAAERALKTKLEAALARERARVKALERRAGKIQTKPLK